MKKIYFNEAIEIYDDSLNMQEVYSKAKELVPWRKGPFKINDLFIDSEWRSNIKFDLLKEHFKDLLKDKIVADVGCNNGYYMFKMLEYGAKKIIGFDPSEHCYKQFCFLNSLINSDIVFERLGVENLINYKHRFDVIFCLGVLYHRSDPINTLKQLKQSLNPSGVLFLDTIYIESDEEIALCPKNSYAKMSNVYFLPSIKALQNWCERAKFKNFTILSKKSTDTDEQRKTEWINSHSLEDFLSKDGQKTIEGYESPKRIYVKLEI